MTDRKEPLMGIWDDDLPVVPRAELHIINNGPKNDSATTMFLAVISAAIICVGSWIAYTEYKAFARDREVRAELEAVRQKAEIEKQRLALERARAAEVRRTQQAYRASNADSMTRAINNARLQASQTCQFWRQQHETNPTERTEAEVAKNCPLG